MEPAMLDDLRSPSDTKEDFDSHNVRDESLRQRAIRQIRQRRHFHVEFIVSGFAMLLLVLIWGASEYHNAGGWPTEGFSQSSGIHDVWNFWIIYPLIGWVLIMGGRAWTVYRHRPISESEIQREIDRQEDAVE
jgi:2TM domain